VRTDHFADESELVASLLDELLDLATAEALLDVLPVLLLVAHLEPLRGEALHGLPVALVLRHRLDLLQRLRVQPDQHLPRVRHHIQPHDPRRLFHPRQEWPCDRPQEHRLLGLDTSEPSTGDRGFCWVREKWASACGGVWVAFGWIWYE
jgi:hypothetical protein